MCCNCTDLMKDDFTIYGTQFTSPKEYSNEFLKGRFRLYLRGIGFLTKGVEWDYLSTGGFGILIAGWVVTSDTIVNGHFY